MAAVKSSGWVRASIAVIASAIVVAALVALHQPRHASRESALVALPSQVDGTASAAARSASPTQADPAVLSAPVVDASVVACERKLQSLGIDERSEQVDMWAFEREARHVEDRAGRCWRAPTRARALQPTSGWRCRPIWRACFARVASPMTRPAADMPTRRGPAVKARPSGSFARRCEPAIGRLRLGVPGLPTRGR